MSADDFTLVNRGTLSSFEAGPISSLDAGAYVAGQNATILNFGTITGLGVSATVYAARAEGESAVLTNYGTVTTNSYGLIAGGDGATLTNSGTVTADGQRGVEIWGTGSTLINSGDISGSSRGIQANTNNTSVTNTGSIAARDFGIITFGDDTTIQQSGTIASDGRGINILGENTFVDQTGAITAVGVGVVSFAAGATIHHSGAIVSGFDGIGLGSNSSNSRIFNTGTIQAGDFGIVSEADNTTIDTSGTIIAAGEGIEIAGDTASVTISGLVRSENSVSVDFDGDNSTLTLTRNARLEGALSFDGANGTLNLPSGGNFSLRHDGGAPAVINAGSGVVILDGNTINVLNPDQFAAGLTQTTATARLAHQNVRAASTPPSQTFLSTSGGTQRNVWVEFGGTYEDRSGPEGYTVQTGGATVGAQIAPGLDVFMGLSRSTANLSGTFESDTQAAYIGASGWHDIAAWQLNWSVIAGGGERSLDTTLVNNQAAGGAQTTALDIDQRFFSPALFVQRPIGDRTRFGLELRYLALDEDAYSTTINGSNVDVAARRNHSFSLTPQISWSVETKKPGTRLDLTAGLELMHANNEAVDITISNIQTRFDSGEAEDSARVFLGADLESALANGWSLRSHGQVGRSTESRSDVSVSVSLMRRF
ncbi:MAG: hypothetical protein AB8B71_00600 [Paracoccaceae bacterium]